METDLAKSLSQQNDKIDALRGEIHALRGAFAVLIAHVALLTRAPHAKRDEILRNVESMLPSALAQIEHDASPASAAGFERSIETLTHLARNAVRFDPVTSGEAGTPTTRDVRR